MKRPDPRPDTITRLIAEILAGTQVPRSLGVLGAATGPWDELRKELKINGWVTAEEIARLLMKNFASYKLRTALEAMCDGTTANWTAKLANARAALAAPEGATSASVEDLRERLDRLREAAGRIAPCVKHRPLRSPLCALCQLHARMEESKPAPALAAEGGPK